MGRPPTRAPWRSSRPLRAMTPCALGLEQLGDEAWQVLAASGVRLLRAADHLDAVGVLTDEAAQVAITDVGHARELVRSVRAEPELAAVYVVVCAGMDDDLRAALDAGADDVMRLPFEPEVVARVVAGLRAGRLRANEALLRSLVANITGAVYRCACDEDWTMLWLSGEIEEISGYRPSDFIGSRVRTFASLIHPDDRARVERSVLDGVAASLLFTIEYRIVRADGAVRWVLERGQAQEAGDGRRWLDGAIFDVTARRAAEQAERERELVEAKLAEVRASRMRIIEAADRARREIEHNLHDGAQQRFVTVALRLQLRAGGEPRRSRGGPGGSGRGGRRVAGRPRPLPRPAHGLYPAVLTGAGWSRSSLGATWASVGPST